MIPKPSAPTLQDMNNNQQVQYSYPIRSVNLQHSYYPQVVIPPYNLNQQAYFQSYNTQQPGLNLVPIYPKRVQMNQVEKKKENKNNFLKKIFFPCLCCFYCCIYN